MSSFVFHIVNLGNILVCQLTLFYFALVAECKPLGRAGKSLFHILTSHALCQTPSIYIVS